jgi:cardiolipin synthase
MATHLRGRGIRLTDGNRLRFFDNGHDKFQDLLAEVQQARSFIHLEYFNFRNDSIAGLLFHLLAQKAREGVEVRALYDSFGNSSNNRPISRQQHDSICGLGIRLEKFDPIRFPWVNHIIPRDHRKIVVIDGRVAYTGGMNVADYYIEGIPGIGEWHDLHMHIEGPAVDDLNHIFTRIWQRVTGEALSGVKYFPREYGVEMTPSGAAVPPSGLNANPKFFMPLHQRLPAEARLAIIDRSTGRQSDAIRDLYATMLDAAQYSVKIVNPYFVPTHRVRAALKRAIDRGVDVEILLSARGDIPMTPDAAHYVGNNMMKRGARVYLYEGGFHHTKMMIVDDLFCTVGSANLDSRSLRCDYEVNTLILSREHTRLMADLFEDQKRYATQIHKGYWHTKKPWKRFLGWLGNLLTPFM